MSKRKAASPRFVLGMAIVCVLASSYPLYVAWQTRRLESASEPSTCEILRKGVRVSESEDSPDSYYPVVEIAHIVDGQRYTREDSGKRFISESDARQATAHLAIGSEVGCRYVAGSPAEVVALERDPGQFRGMLFFGLFLWVMPLGIFLWERKQPGWRGP
jgi:hypothetical protein